MGSERQWDFAVLGATGYTGQLCSEHVATALPTNINWAIAGRSRQKLATLAQDLKKLNADRNQPGKPICLRICSC